MARLVFLRRAQYDVATYGGEVFFDINNKNIGKLALTDCFVDLPAGTYKIKMYKGNLSYTQMPNTPEHCKTMNEDLSTYDFNTIKKELDYMYYIYRTLDLLDIQWKELSGNNFNQTNRFEYNF
jgi:hypothetical protein